MKLQERIKLCANSRRGGTRSKDVRLCGSDFCTYCSRDKTDWFRKEVKSFLRGANDPHFTTILLKPCKTYAEALEQYHLVIDKLRQCDTNMIGVFEIADKENCRYYDHFCDVMNSPNCYWGIPHIHLVTRIEIEDLKRLFPVQYQAKQIRINGDIDQSIDRISQYMRKRRLAEKWWINEAEDCQPLFRIVGDIVEYDAWDSVDTAEDSGSNGVTYLTEGLEDTVKTLRETDRETGRSLEVKSSMSGYTVVDDEKTGNRRSLEDCINDFKKIPGTKWTERRSIPLTKKTKAKKKIVKPELTKEEKKQRRAFKRLWGYNMESTGC